MKGKQIRKQFTLLKLGVRQPSDQSPSAHSLRKPVRRMRANCQVWQISLGAGPRRSAEYAKRIRAILDGAPGKAAA